MKRTETNLKNIKISLKKTEIIRISVFFCTCFFMKTRANFFLGNTRKSLSLWAFPSDGYLKTGLCHKLEGYDASSRMLPFLMSRRENYKRKEVDP